MAYAAVEPKLNVVADLPSYAAPTNIKLSVRLKNSSFVKVIFRTPLDYTSIFCILIGC